MKNKYLILTLLSTIVISGCATNNNTSSSKIKGSWETIIAPQIRASHGGKVNPFNTAMSLKYFISDEIENKSDVITDITSIYQENISDLHCKFDRHNSYYLDQNDSTKGTYNNIKTVNNSLDTNKPIKLDQETYDLLKLGVKYTKYTEGYFNIFVGEITDFWDDLFYSAYNFGDIELDPYYDENQRLKLEKLVACVPDTFEEIDSVLKFNDDTLEVTFNSLKDVNGNALGNLSISVGGIAKGYATDLLKDKLVNNNYNQGYLFSGASSITSLSKPISSKEEGQYLSVIDPRTANSIDGVEAAFGVYLKDEFNMSTSGNYTSGKSYMINNTDIIRHHIINSLTGYPEYEENISSVSVFSKSLTAGVLDAFSTTLVNKSVKEGIEFRKKVMNDFNCDLEIVYIKQNVKENTIEVITTSDFNGTFEVSNRKGIGVQYVKE